MPRSAQGSAAIAQHQCPTLESANISRVPHPCDFFLSQGWETTNLDPAFSLLTLAHNYDRLAHTIHSGFRNARIDPGPGALQEPSSPSRRKSKNKKSRTFSNQYVPINST